MEDTLHTDIVQLLNRIDESLKPETVIDLTQRLVSIPSHTAEGEKEAASVLEGFFQQSGVPTRRQYVENAGVNVIATLPSAKDVPGLLFNGHLDTVAPSSAMPFPPFAAVIEDGQMWGREPRI